MTLTYRPKKLPLGGTLVPDHLSGFMKALRQRLPLAESVRFFGVGEYGEKTWRPHYHALLFGLGTSWEYVIAQAWGRGGVHVGTVTEESIQYCVGYVLKKMTKKDDPALGGRHPEFVRMSRNPGIAGPCVRDIAKAISRDFVAYSVEGDVPRSLRHGRKEWPLDRYLRDKIREEIGHEKVEFQRTALGQKQAQEMRELRGKIAEVKENREAYESGRASRRWSSKKVEEKFHEELARLGRVSKKSWLARKGVTGRSL